MKKLLSMLLALIMVFSLATVALADESTTNNTIKITKNYDVKNGTAPSETFTFTDKNGNTATNVGADKYYTYSVVDKDGTWTLAETVPTGAPTITIGSAAFDENKAAATTAYTADASITVNNYTKAPVGKYTYTVNEKADTTAGVTYYGNEIEVVVTILNGENDNSYVAAVHTETSGTKSDAITNTYDAGTLSVTKEIKGEGAEMKDKFEFTITLTAPTGTTFNADVQNVAASTNSVTGTKTTNKDGTVAWKVTLGNGDTFKLANIPVGTTFEIKENAEDYTESHETYDKAAKIIGGGDNQSFTFTNTRGMNNIDTGVITESAPYILLIAVCAVAAVLFVTKRRRVEF